MRRGEKSVDWAMSIQNAVDYIEDHITEDIDYEETAKRAACSYFYFQRIFGIMCGYPLGEYIRNRRLSIAGSELSVGKIKVIDAALKYGYDSPESFTRAFAKFHGITPSQARRNGGPLKSFSRISVQIVMKGGSVMDYKIVKKKAFRVIERVEKHSIDNGVNKNTIPGFWTRAHADGTVKKLLELTSDKRYIYGICYGNVPTDCKTFDYSIAAVCGSGCAAPEGFTSREIPERTWAVFECKGAMPEAIQRLWHRILSEFFPTSGYEPTYEMEIEAYTDGNMTDPDYISEIWVPVKEKR